ncbi:hypothetical protein, partial [Roseomonas mucosa]
MGLDAASLDLSERQALGGKHGGKTRAAGTDAKISAAVARLQAAGRPLTQAAIAAEAGVSDRTVRSRWKPENQCPSGVAPRGAPPATGRASSESKESLSALAAKDRAIRRTVAALGASAVAARRPGAVPAALPSVAPELLAVPEVRRARRDAEAALVDARRRAETRADRAAAVRRRAEMVEAITASDDLGRAWWRRATSDLGAVFDRLEAEAAGDRDALARLTRQRDAAFGALTSQWRAAQRDVARDRLAAELVDQIPW